jgi:K+-transporting ATPase KdpF subunit
LHDRFFRGRDCLHRGLREAQVEVPMMNLENFAMLLISFFLMVYLIYALLRPEKF